MLSEEDFKKLHVLKASDAPPPKGRMIEVGGEQDAGHEVRAIKRAADLRISPLGLLPPTRPTHQPGLDR